MLFSKETYIGRRAQLRQMVQHGVIVLFGNNDSPMNYPSNTYKFRQDSSFLYFYGQHRNGLAGIIDADSGEEYLVGDEIDIDDIVWYGSVTTVKGMAEECGVAHVLPMSGLADMIGKDDRCISCRLIATTIRFKSWIFSASTHPSSAKLRRWRSSRL